MLQNPTQEIHLRTRTYLPPAGAAGLAITVGVAYFLATQLSDALIAEPDGVAVFWPAAGVSSGVLITLGRAARLPVASGLIVATIIANLMMGDWNVWSAAAFALWNTGEPLLVAWLRERCFGSGFILDRLRNVLGLLAAAVVATAASGIGGMVASKLLHSPATPIWIIWEHWFASGTVGIITVAPLVIGLGAALREPPPRNEILEGVLALVLLVAMTVITVLMPPDPWQMVRPIALLFPILLWLAARCQPAFAAAAVFIISLAIIWAVTFGSSPFRILAFPIGDRMTGVQVAILIIALCEYLLAALFAERRKHTGALEESEARLQEALTALQEALAAGEVVAFECDLRSGLARHSGNAAQILGLGQTVTLAEFLGRIPPDDRARIEAHQGRLRVDSPADTVAFRFIRPDRSEVWLEKTSRAQFDAAGRLIRLQGLTRDITRYKQAEKRQDMLSAELDHRVRNVLARVAAVVRHTQRRCGTTDEFVQAIEGRIQSIAAAHTLLSQGRWSGVGLADLMRQQLAPYTTDANTAIAGPDVTLTSAQTQAVAMVIHELATNAAKHGALSSPDGNGSVSWDRTGTGATAVLTITWRELGGQPSSGPIRLWLKPHPGSYSS
jgi:two-component sensor histidine kinase/integral membrane sensor domain MASE1